MARHLLSRWYKLVDSCYIFFLQEEAIVLANVAERAERYDDMIEYMKVHQLQLIFFLICVFSISVGKCKFLPIGGAGIGCFFFPFFPGTKNHVFWSHGVFWSQDRVKAGKALSREEREMFSAAFKAAVSCQL